MSCLFSLTHLTVLSHIALLARLSNWYYLVSISYIKLFAISLTVFSHTTLHITFLLPVCLIDIILVSISCICYFLYISHLQLLCLPDSTKKGWLIEIIINLIKTPKEQGHMISIVTIRVYVLKRMTLVKNIIIRTSRVGGHLSVIITNLT